MDACRLNLVFLWHKFYPPWTGTWVLLQGTMWHFIQIIWLLLVSHALRNVWSFWHQLIPHSALEITLTLTFSPVFHFIQEACAMPLLITQHSNLTQIQSASHLVAPWAWHLCTDQFRTDLNCALSCCVATEKVLINLNCRMKPWLLTFFALPFSMNGGQAFLPIPSARAHPSRTCQMLSFPPTLSASERSTLWMEFNRTLNNCFSPSSQSKQHWDLDWNSASSTYTGALKLHKAGMFCFVWGRLMRLTKQKWYRYLWRVSQCIW